ncbi:MAG: ABC transporter ATP-binding protein [Phycisphaerae bacterium]|jgi:ABC-type multidrug transport system ATPase subunit|nr:ABC transporter ATP-binding protein [Phycisphaerae bacterium]
MSSTSTQSESQQRAPVDPPAVRTNALCLRLDDRLILKDINLTVPTGQTVALLGANGAGKSTLLKVLATFMLPSSGTLELFGSPVGANSNAIRSKIGIISHQPMLYRDLSAMENLIFFGRLYSISNPRARAEEMLSLVGLSNRADDAVKTLSRGMIQRVSIARALMHDPSLLLADEPFDGLDVPSANALEAFLGRLQAQGKTVVIANHDIAQTLRLTDSVFVLHRGCRVLEARADDIEVADVVREMTG